MLTLSRDHLLMGRFGSTSVGDRRLLAFQGHLYARVEKCSWPLVDDVFRVVKRSSAMNRLFWWLEKSHLWPNPRLTNRRQNAPPGVESIPSYTSGYLSSLVRVSSMVSWVQVQAPRRWKMVSPVVDDPVGIFDRRESYPYGTLECIRVSV